MTSSNADLDGDGEITNLDRKRCDLTAVPQIVFGLNFSATYKNWDFMALFQGRPGPVITMRR